MAAVGHAIDCSFKPTPNKQVCIKGRLVNNLKSARGLSIEPASGNIYVVERANFRLQVFSPEGVHLFFIYTGMPHVDLWGIHIDNGLIYVTDYLYGKIYVFTLAGEIVSHFGKGFTKMGVLIKLVQPMGLSVDRDGDIYVCEFGAKQVIVFEKPFLKDNLHTFPYHNPHTINFNADGDKLSLITEEIIRYGKEHLSLETNRLSYTAANSPRATCWFGCWDAKGKLILSDMRGFNILIFETSSGNPVLIQSIKMTRGCPMGIGVDSYGRIVCATNSTIYFFGKENLLES